MWSSANISIQAIIHVKKSDGTESYYSDFQFHDIPLESAGAWDSHTLDVTSLELPAGATILGVNFIIFFEASSGHDGFICVDNVTPIVTPIEEPSNLLVNPKADEGTNGWTFYKYGSADSGVLTMANNNNVFYVQSNGNDCAYIYQNIDLPESSGGKYLLLLGYGWVEHIYSGYTANRPFLFGYEMNQSNKIINHLQDQNMWHTATEKTWQTMSGIYQINVDAAKIRLFLFQAFNAYPELAGTKAVFDDLELLVFDTEAEAIAYENTYTSDHPEVYEEENDVTILESSVPVSGLSGVQGDEAFYKIQVPSGATELEVKISGGTGDCDLYVKQGAQPTITDYDYRPYINGNNETVTVNNPSTGWWYIMLRGYWSYSDVTLVAQTTGLSLGVQGEVIAGSLDECGNHIIISYTSDSEPVPELTHARIDFTGTNAEIDQFGSMCVAQDPRIISTTKVTNQIIEIGFKGFYAGESIELGLDMDQLYSGAGCPYGSDYVGGVVELTFADLPETCTLPLTGNFVETDGYTAEAAFSCKP